MGVSGIVQLWLLASLATIANCRVLRPRILRPRDTTYSANVRDASIGGSFGFPTQTTTLDAGVTYFITGQGPHALFGNIVNSGDLIVTQADAFLGTGGIVSTPLAVGYAGGGGTDGVLVTNPGSLISLNDYGDVSLVSPSIYQWAIYSMENAGTIQWCGNGAPPTGSTFLLACASNECVNNGLITWEQYNDDNGALFNWVAGGTTAIGASGFAPTNNGAFRLINTDLQITQNIVSTVNGGGCFVLGQNGLMSFQSGFSGVSATTATFTGQSIYFTDSTAGLYISPVVYTTNRNFGAPLYGFGQGNYIAFTEPILPTILFGTQSFSYSNGILTVNFVSGNRINLNIGPGYTLGSFATTLQLDLTRNPGSVVAVVYNAAAPARTPPNVCVVNYPVCADPAATVTASFASSTSTAVTSLSASLSTSVSVSASTSISVPTSVSTPDVQLGTTTVFVTITSTSVGLAVPATTTIPPVGTGAGTVTGTVEIVTPAVFVTATTLSGTAAPFTTTIAPSGAAPGTVLIVDPLIFVTVTANSVGATAPVTYTVPPAGTAPGTVVIVEPSNTNYVTTTLPYTGVNPYTSAVTVSTAQPSGTAPGTVYVSLVDAVLATVTLPYSGSVTATTTIAPTNGVPGTVEILTPTVSRPASLSTNIGPNQCICRPRATA